jgi:hypothetical protein
MDSIKLLFLFNIINLVLSIFFFLITLILLIIFFFFNKTWHSFTIFYFNEFFFAVTGLMLQFDFLVAQDFAFCDGG